MTDTRAFSGVLSPVVTPFDAQLRPNGEQLVRQCRWLLDNDVGLAVFGTNSEANSLSLQEKASLLSLLGAPVGTENPICHDGTRR